MGGLAPIVVAGALVGVRGEILASTVALLLMVVVVAVAAVGGRAGGAAAAITAALSFDFFHTRPYLSLSIVSRDDVETAALLLVAGLIVGTMAGRSGRARQSAAASSSRDPPHPPAGRARRRRRERHRRHPRLPGGADGAARPAGLPLRGSAVRLVPPPPGAVRRHLWSHHPPLRAGWLRPAVGRRRAPRAQPRPARRRASSSTRPPTSACPSSSRSSPSPWPIRWAPPWVQHPTTACERTPHERPAVLDLIFIAVIVAFFALCRRLRRRMRSHRRAGRVGRARPGRRPTRTSARDSDGRQHRRAGDRRPAHRLPGCRPPLPREAVDDWQIPVTGASWLQLAALVALLAVTIRRSGRTWPRCSARKAMRRATGSSGRSSGSSTG